MKSLHPPHRQGILDAAFRLFGDDFLAVTWSLGTTVWLGWGVGGPLQDQGYDASVNCRPKKSMPTRAIKIL